MGKYSTISINKDDHRKLKQLKCTEEIDTDSFTLMKGLIKLAEKFPDELISMIQELKAG